MSPALYDSGFYDYKTPYFSWNHCTNWRLGYYGDFVFNREMEEVISGAPSANIHQLTLVTNAGTLTVDICDYLDLYLLVGTTKLAYNTEGMFGEFAYLNFSTTPCWSFGGAIDLWQCGCFAIGFEGQYLQTKPLLDSYTNLGSGSLIYFNDLNRMKWREWQGGMTLSYLFYDVSNLSLSPYIGVKAASGKLRQHGFQFSDDGLILVLNLLETRKLWGFALGTTLVSKGIMGVTVEGRWADEKAIYGNMQLSY